MILIVEDNENFQFVLKVFFENQTIKIAKNLQAALNLLSENPKFILTDYDFPGGGFPALLPHIKNREYLVMSSHPRFGEGITAENFINKSEIVTELNRKLHLW